MTAKKVHDSKDHALRQKGARNRHPERVTDESFRQDDFFDPRDLVQVKYEMIRRVRKEDKTVTEASTAFGMSRFSFYQANATLEQEGIPGLVPKKPGPRGGHKLNAEVLAYVNEELMKNSDLAIGDLLNSIRKHFGLTVHRRTLERALADPKKKP